MNYQFKDFDDPVLFELERWPELTVILEQEESNTTLNEN